VIGAGVGGLTAAGLLLRAGHRVSVLEANVYPGGCAGTFYHQGYYFDAGATLAGGFGRGGPHARVAELLDLEWPVARLDPAWVVHLPGRSVTQWADRDRWREERMEAFPGTEQFWEAQETLADAAWDIASRAR
jgi:phytoene dehydrogenase-like protein